MSTNATDFALERYSRSDLRHLRLESLPLLVIGLYVAAVAFTQLPVDLNVDQRYWIGAAATLLTLVVIAVWRLSAWLAGAILVAGTFVGWVLALRLFDAEVVVWLAFLVVGIASTLLGSRAACLTTVLVSLGILIIGSGGHLSPDFTVGSIVATWVGFALLWLTARPVTITLEWAWGSYVDAREKRDQLRQQQGELRRTVRSLELAYRRLEHLNDELNRARRAAEEARRLKSEFAASISHELRTPLNLILGFSEMLVMLPHTYGGGRRPPTYQADLDTIYRNAQHLAALIDDVLDLSQIEAGRVGLTRDWVNLAEVVEESARAVRGRFEHLGLTLNFAISSDLPQVFVDRTRIRQVLINLLNNAVRFTDEGGVRVTAVRRENEIVVSVADTGVGIPREEIDHVFDEFFQTSGALQRRAGGSGLGLTISKRFVELHGGAMWVESEPGNGATFSFTVPLIEHVTTGTLPGDWELWDRIVRSRPPDPPTLGVLTDDEAVARTFQRHLDHYQVTAVYDEAGLARLVGERVVRGIIVPTTSPSASIKAVSRLAELGIGVPVATCILDAWRERAAELGISAFLTKPIFRDQVKDALGKLGKRVRTILIVDDSADMVRLLARTIRALSRRYEVMQATDGREALALMHERLPDAVLLDLLMPEIDGYSVLQAMREDDRLHEIPVIAVSAHATTTGERVVGELTFTRPGGLGLDELMRCITGCFDAVQTAREDHNVAAMPATPNVSPASEPVPPHREPSRARLREAPNR